MTLSLSHSSFDEAIEVSKKFMQTCYTIRTHFSQRYSLSKLLATALAPGVSLAFDHMSMSGCAMLEFIDMEHVFSSHPGAGGTPLYKEAGVLVIPLGFEISVLVRLRVIMTIIPTQFWGPF